MSTEPRRPLLIVVWLAIGIASAIVGLLPWLVTGARLPVQNLAADQTSLETPFALLPFNQYFLTSIVALLVVGGALAGIAARALRDRRPRGGTLLLVGGVLAVQILAGVQSSVVTVGSLEESTHSERYSAAVIVVIVVSIAMSLLVLLLIARAPVAGATIALAMTAVVSGSWIGVAIRDLVMLGPFEVVQVLLGILRWIPPVLVGCAIAWCGFRTVGRIVAALVSLAALWIGPAFFTAVANAAGSRVLASDPAGMLDYGVGVFRMALTKPELVLPPLIVASVIGAAGAGLLELSRRRRRRVTGAASP